MQVYSIFTSCNGEVCASHQGSICTFIRLSGCHVGCSYCDTKYANDPKSGKQMDPDEILGFVTVLNTKNITITGGEPMEQYAELHKLVCMLLISGFNVSIETSGEVPFSRRDFPINPNLSFVVDIKNPSVVNTHQYIDMNLEKNDFLKVVIGSDIQFHNAVQIKNVLQACGCKARFAFSAMENVIKPIRLLKLMQRYRCHDAILNLQIHKLMELQEDK